MAPLDFRLLLAVSIIALLSLTTGVLCIRRALHVAGEKDGDLKMFLWSFAALIAFVISGMSMAYVALPIIIHSL
jgi:hypothetical protein